MLRRCQRCGLPLKEIPCSNNFLCVNCGLILAEELNIELKDEDKKGRYIG